MTPAGRRDDPGANVSGAAGVEFRRLTPEWSSPLLEFLRRLEQTGEVAQFHPHPFSRGRVESLARGTGSDLYYIAAFALDVIAYGLLRGWDDGYAVPSLGIAVHPGFRGRGIGRAFMAFLHLAAGLHGAQRIRLKVYPRNDAALQLYRSLGYRFSGEEDGQLVGYYDLMVRKTPSGETDS